MAADPNTFGYRWDLKVVKQTESKNGSLVKLPDYFHLVKSGGKPQWVPVPAAEVPPETVLAKSHFDGPEGRRPKAYVTPDDAASCWKKPGPVAGPFQARLGDGSVVTYYWYRFADQPAMINADLTPEEREVAQKRVEKLHRALTKERNYLAPPEMGRLASLDPALILTPPRGMEVGHVPMATRQELAGAATYPSGSRGQDGAHQ